MVQTVGTAFGFAVEMDFHGSYDCPCMHWTGDSSADDNKNWIAGNSRGCFAVADPLSNEEMKQSASSQKFDAF